MESPQEKNNHEPLMNVKKNTQKESRVEERYNIGYQSIASSIIAQADTAQLDSLVKTIENEEFSKDSLMDTVLYHVDKLLNQIGYNSSIFESRSKRKITTFKNSLNADITALDEKIIQENTYLSKTDNLIAKYSLDLKDYQKKLEIKKEKLREFEKEIADYSEIEKKSLDPKKHMYLEQAKLDYELQEQEVGNLDDACNTTFSMIQGYYSQRAQCASSKSRFEAEKIVAQSLNDQLSLDLDRASSSHPIKVLAHSRSKITSAYKMQDDLLNKDNRLSSLYNQKVEFMPTYTKMSQELSKKRNNLPKIKR